MTDYRDLFFFVPAVLAILFMLWVLVKFTQQLAGPAKSAREGEAERSSKIFVSGRAKSAREGEAEPRYLHAIPADAQRGRASVQD